MKLVIEIDDVKSRSACIHAVRRLYRSLEEHHGGREAASILGSYHDDSSYDYATAKFSAICDAFTPEELRLLLEYYAMPKPSKQRLAIDLAKKNESLPPTRRYGARGTTNPMTMLKQIKRVFKREQSHEVAAFTPTQMEEARARAEAWSTIHASIRVSGGSVKRGSRRLRRS